MCHLLYNEYCLVEPATRIVKHNGIRNLLAVLLEKTFLRDLPDIGTWCLGLL